MTGDKVDKIFRGTITAWQLHHLSVPQEVLDELTAQLNQERILPLIITGTVLNDSSGRMEPGWHMRTSPLTMLDETEGYCESRTSIYRLDGENGNDVMPDLSDGVLTIFY